MKKKALSLECQCIWHEITDWGHYILRGHPSHAKVEPLALQRKYLHFSVILRPWVLVRPRESNPRPPALQSTRSTDWANTAAVKWKLTHLKKAVLNVCNTQQQHFWYVPDGESRKTAVHYMACVAGGISGRVFFVFWPRSGEKIGSTSSCRTALNRGYFG